MDGNRKSLFHHQITAAQIRMVEPSQHFEFAIGMNFAQIGSADETATVDVSKVNDIDASGFAGCGN